MSPARTFTERFFFAVAETGEAAIWDRGEQPDCTVQRVEFGTARYLCAKFRHLGIDAQEAAPLVAEFCRARMIELHDAIGAWLRTTRAAA